MQLRLRRSLAPPVAPCSPPPPRQAQIFSKYPRGGALSAPGPARAPDFSRYPRRGGSLGTRGPAGAQRPRAQIDLSTPGGSVNARARSGAGAQTSLRTPGGRGFGPFVFCGFVGFAPER